MDLLIFDLDGTLIDSKEDLCCAVNATRAHRGMPALANETVYSYVGEGAPVLIRRVLGSRATEADVKDALAFFLAYYNDHMIDHTALYPGVRETLDRLREAGVKMAVLTNKPERMSRAILEGLGLAARFVAVLGGDSLPVRKPDPGGLDQLRALTGTPRERMLLVGDSGIDLRTARAGGVAFCGVSWGLVPEALAAAQPGRVIAHPRELIALVEGGLG